MNYATKQGIIKEGDFEDYNVPATRGEVAYIFAHALPDGVLKEVSTYEIIDPKDIGLDDNNIVLTARSGHAALRYRLETLGIKLSDEKLDAFYQEFLKLADKKKQVNDDDLLVLAGAERAAVAHIKLDYLQVTSGKGLKPVASIGLDIAGEKFEGAAQGNGPVDAAINALKTIVHRQMVIKEFTIQNITKGSDDVAKVHMPSRRCTCRWSTRGTSTTASAPTRTS